MNFHFQNPAVLMSLNFSKFLLKSDLEFVVLIISVTITDHHGILGIQKMLQEIITQSQAKPSLR